MTQKTIQWDFLITEELAKAIALRSVMDGVDRSAVAQKALKNYLSDTLALIKRLEEREFTKK